MDSPADPLPPYAYVPGGPWPHPRSSPQGHSFGEAAEKIDPAAQLHIEAIFRRGMDLFDAGYYWEAHEAWEILWHAFGRKGETADLLRGLIKLAAAGVKVRERQPHGVKTHARRAAELFESLVSPNPGFGLDLGALRQFARHIESSPPDDPNPPGTAVSIVFDVRLRPHDAHEAAPSPAD